MRAVLCKGFDGIKALSFGEAAEPAPQADEVLIDVHAASVSYMDYLKFAGATRCGPLSLTCRERMPRGSSSAAARMSNAFALGIELPAEGGSVVLQSA